MYGTKFLIADHYYINNVVREDSQIDFATGKVSLHVWEGGGGDRRTFPSQSSNNQFFQAEKILLARKKHNVT